MKIEKPKDQALFKKPWSLPALSQTLNQTLHNQTNVMDFEAGTVFDPKNYEKS
jgi:hypothetical protein